MMAKIAVCYAQRKTQGDDVFIVKRPKEYWMVIISQYIQSQYKCTMC